MRGSFSTIGKSCFRAYLENRLRLQPTKPTNPVPSRSIEDGSGTVVPDVPPVVPPGYWEKSCEKSLIAAVQSAGV